MADVEIWVDNVGGNDANPGTELSPKATLNGVNGALSVCDNTKTNAIYIVHNAGNPYIGADNRNVALTGFTAGNDTTPSMLIEGIPAGGAYPILDNDQNLSVPTLNVDNADYVTIRKLTFYSNNSVQPVGIRTRSTTGHALIELVEFPDAGADGWYGRYPIELSQDADANSADIEIRCVLFNTNSSTNNARGIRIANAVDRLWVRHCVFRYDNVVNTNLGIEKANRLDAGESYDIENCTFSGCTYYSVGLVGPNAALGRCHIKDCIIEGNTNGFRGGIYLEVVQHPAASVVSDYNDFWNNNVDTMGLPNGFNDIFLNPNWVGGGAATWVDLISVDTNLLPQTAGVLTGAQDGRCQGGWLPATEQMPCMVVEPDPPDPPPDPPDPPDYDNCAGLMGVTYCPEPANPANGACHVASTTQPCPICGIPHTWAQAWVAAQFSTLGAGHCVQINNDASTIGGTPNSNVYFFPRPSEPPAARFPLGSINVSSGGMLEGFPIAGTPSMGGGTLKNCWFQDRAGFPGVRGTNGHLWDCTMDADRSEGVLADGVNVGFGPINVCGCTFSEQVDTVFSAVSGGRISVGEATLETSPGVTFNGLVNASGAGSSIQIGNLTMRSGIEFSGIIVTVDAGASVEIRRQAGLFYRPAGSQVIEVNDAQLKLIQCVISSGYTRVERGGTLEIYGGAIADVTNNPTGFGAIEVLSGSILEMSCVSAYGCQATDRGGFLEIDDESMVTIDCCNIRDCSATNTGGAINVENESTLTMTRSSIHDCTAARGGGIYGDASSLNCSELGIYDCEATIAYSGDAALSKRGGGGILAYDCSGYMWRLLVVRCTAVCAGGGLIIEGSKTDITFDRTSLIDCDAAVYGSALFFKLVTNYSDFLNGIVALNNTVEAVRAWTDCANVTVRYTNFWSNAPGNYTNILVANVIYDDPEFCNKQADGFGIVGCTYRVISIAGTYYVEAVYDLICQMARILYGTYSISREAPAASSGLNEGIMGATDPMCDTLSDITDHEIRPEPDIVATCGYSRFYDSYPPDWLIELERKTGCTPITVVCYDPEGEAIQLTCLLKDIRPFVAEMDINMKEIRVQDITLFFNDPDGYLDPHREGSLLYGVDYKEKKIVEIGTWLEGTTSVLIHCNMYLAEAKHDGYVAEWRLKDKFAPMLKRHIKANTVLYEDIEQDGNAELLQVDVDSDWCPIGNWTLTFLDSNQFEVYHELMGYDGTGTTGAPFTSDSGAITIDNSYWDMSGGNPAADDEFSFPASLILERTAVFEALYQCLTTYYDLTNNDLDLANWNQQRASAAHWKIDLIQKDPITALEMSRRLCRHIIGSIFVAPNGRLKIWRYVPQQRGSQQLLIACNRDDLESCKSETTENKDVVICHYGQDEDGALQYSKRLPAVVSVQGLPALPYFEQENKQIFEYDLEYYVLEDRVFIDFILFYMYILKVEPHQVLKIETMLDNIRAQLAETIWIDSARPEYQLCALIYRIEKDFMNNRIKLTGIESEGWLAECRTGQCGYCFCDSGHLCDVCWVCF